VYNRPFIILLSCFFDIEKNNLLKIKNKSIKGKMDIITSREKEGIAFKNGEIIPLETTSLFGKLPVNFFIPEIILM